MRKIGNKCYQKNAMYYKEIYFIDFFLIFIYKKFCFLRMFKHFKITENSELNFSSLI